MTKEGADPLIKVPEEFIKRIDEMKGQMRVFSQEPPLGDHDYGKKVALHVWEAANDDRSARAVLKKLKIILVRSREALLIASKQYDEQEELARDVIQKMGD